MRSHLLPQFGAQPLDAITADSIERFLTTLRTTGAKRGPGTLGDASVAGIWKVLRLLLSRAKKRGLLAVNPVDLLDVRRPPRTSKADPFTADELQDLFEAARALDGDYGTFLETWGRTGARFGEVAGLTRGDLDLTAATVFIRRTYSDRRLGPVKTPSSERVASFALPVAENTDAWRPDPVIAERMRRQLRASSGSRPTRRRTCSWPPTVGRGPPRPFARTGSARSCARASGRGPRSSSGKAARVSCSAAPLPFVLSHGGWRSPAVLFIHYAKWMPQATDVALTHRPATSPQPRAARGRLNA